MNSPLAPKQQHLLSLLKHKQLRRINILYGSVRSGKTYASLILWAFWISTMPVEEAYIMIGKTLLTLKRNILEPLAQLVGRANFTYSISKKEAHLFGRTVHLESASDARSESRIRGMTLLGAYCDELSLFTEDFFSMLLSRLSRAGARLFATTNPDVPSHWLKVNYLDRADDLDLLAVKFTLDDNPFLDPDYVAALKSESSGLFYDRFILGNWVAPQGRVYPAFPANCISDPENIRRILGNRPAVCCAGVDFGGSGSATAFVLTAISRNFQDVCVLEEHASLRKTLVTMDEGDAPVFNTNYEGNPTAGAVKIPVRNNEITPALYNGTDGMTASSASGSFVTVDDFKQYAVNELIDGYEAASAPDDLIANRLASAAYGAALLLDLDAAQTLTQEGTILPDTAELTTANIFAAIVSMATALSKKNVPMAGRWLIVNAATFATLIQCADFVKASDAGQEMLREGVVGKICGFVVRVSNNLVPGVAMIAGHGDWCCRVREWVVEPHLVDLDGSDKYVGALR